MENLNKENFWNEMYQKYPLAMKDFCSWIDEYKKRNDWNDLFHNKAASYDAKHSVKFHDIPIAMQMGIWREYLDVNASEIQICQNDIEIFLNAMQEGMVESENEK